MTHTLYGLPASLFSGKARAFLDNRGTDYREVAVTPDVMRDVILPRIGWAVMPVLELADGQMVQDTADIIAHLDPDGAVYPGGPVQRFVSEWLHMYFDQWMVLPAMHYRWNYNEAWTFAEFGRSALPDADPEAQAAYGRKVGERFRAFVPMLGITPETIPGVEASYEAFLAEMSDHLATHPFLFGGRPTLADYAAYGPLYAHLYRDPASGEIMRRLAPRVADWVARLRDAKGQGAALSDDAVPDTLLPLLARHAREHLPVLAATRDAFLAWAETAQPGEEVPRALGMTAFTVEGRTDQTAMRSFSLLRLQTALDAYAALSGPDRSRADAVLVETGATALADFGLTRRLARKNYRLVLAD